MKPVARTAGDPAARHRRGDSRRRARAKLERAAQSGQPLRVKLGADPSAPDLHLGHTVVLQKLREFQDLRPHRDLPDRRLHRHDRRPDAGARRRASRSTREQVRGQRRDLQEAGLQDPRSASAPRCASTPSGSAAMRAADVVRLAAQYTVARMLERDDFAKRFRENRPIGIHEFLYPLVQGYDSVALARRRRARRHRPEVQSAGRPGAAEGRRTGAAGRRSPCRFSRVPTRGSSTASSSAEDVEVARQRHRHRTSRRLRCTARSWRSPTA